MKVISFDVELDDPEAADAVAAALRDRLTSLDEVEQANLKASTTRDLGSVIVVVGTVVLIARGSADVLGEARRVIANLRGLIEEVDGLRRILVDLRDRQVELDALDDADDEEIASMIRTT